MIASHRYRVIATRHEIDLGHLVVTATDEADAVIMACEKMPRALHIDPYDVHNGIRVEPDQPCGPTSKSCDCSSATLASAKAAIS